MITTTLRINKKCIILFFIGFSFNIIETYFFGNNFFPSSLFELFCDLIAVFLYCLALDCFRLEYIKEKRNDNSFEITIKEILNDE